MWKGGKDTLERFYGGGGGVVILIPNKAHFEAPKLVSRWVGGIGRSEIGVRTLKTLGIWGSKILEWRKEGKKSQVMVWAAFPFKAFTNLLEKELEGRGRKWDGRGAWG